MAGLGELFIELGVFADTKELQAFEKKVRNYITGAEKELKNFNKTNDSFQKKLKDIGKNIVPVIAALTAAGYALNRLTNDLVQSNQAMLNLTRTSDISLSTFQKWGSIGKMLGVNNAAQQLEGLNQRLVELRLTGQGARGFQLAGINPTGDANSVMEQLRARVSGMSDTSASYLLREMGLDPQMLHLLRLSREEFEELGKTIKKYQLTEQQRAEIQRMNIQLEIARQQLQYLKDRAILAIMPYWVKFVQWIEKTAEAAAKITKWILKSKNIFAIITRILLGTIAGITVLVTLLSLIPKLLTTIVMGVNVLRTALTLLAAHPVIAFITALTTSLILLADDFMVYSQNGDSVIGHILNMFDEIDNKINAIDTPQWAKDLLALFKNGNNFLAAWNDIDNARNGGTVKTSNVQKANTIIKYTPLGGLLKPMTQLTDAMIGLQSTIEIFNRHFGNNGKATGGAAGISSNGYEGMLPALEHKNAVSPATEQAINNSSVSNNSNSTTTLSMNNYFNTNQPAYDIERELRYVTAQFAKGTI